MFTVGIGARGFIPSSILFVSPIIWGLPKNLFIKKNLYFAGFSFVTTVTIVRALLMRW